MAARTTPVEEAKKAVLDLRARRGQFESERATAAASLIELEAGAGARAVDNPGAGPKIAKEIAELRAFISISDQAVEELDLRISAAESAYLLAEADVLQVPLDAAKRARDLHHAKTTELLEALEEHDGVPYIPKVLLEQRDYDLGRHGPREFVMGRTFELENRIDELEVGPQILRDLAAGRDPGKLLEDYPACLVDEGALVVVPAVARRRAVHQGAELATRATEAS